jgi:hypothetical protein
MEIIRNPTYGNGIGNGQCTTNGPLYTYVQVYIYICIYNMYGELIELIMFFSSKPCLPTGG